MNEEYGKDTTVLKLRRFNHPTPLCQLITGNQYGLNVSDTFSSHDDLTQLSWRCGFM